MGPDPDPKHCVESQIGQIDFLKAIDNGKNVEISFHSIFLHFLEGLCLKTIYRVLTFEQKYGISRVKSGSMLVSKWKAAGIGVERKMFFFFIFTNVRQSYRENLPNIFK